MLVESKNIKPKFNIVSTVMYTKQTLDVSLFFLKCISLVHFVPVKKLYHIEEAHLEMPPLYNNEKVIKKD